MARSRRRGGRRNRNNGTGNRSSHSNGSPPVNNGGWLGPGADRIDRRLAALLAPRGKLPGHAGLIFDRYLPLWAEDGDYRDRATRELLACFARATRVSPQDERAAALATRLARLDRLCRLRGGQWFEATLASPLVIGLGLPHPTENGFLFDPVLGLPWLPGTAVKGLCRRGATLLGADEEEIGRLLGPEPEPDEQWSGAVAFLDAWPTRWPKLAVQVITPHYVSYYRSRLEGGPREDFWDEPHGLDDPVPIYFLGVEAGTSYRFACLPRPDACAADLDTVREWLACGLEVLGAGGKTAVGYGAFDVAEEQGGSA